MSDHELEQINQLITEAIAASNVSAGDGSGEARRSRMLANVKRRSRAPAPEGTYTVRADDMPWEVFDTGIERKRVVTDHGDGTHSCIYRLQPGAKFRSHPHKHQETCWVISGEVLVGEHPLQAGDMHVAEVNFDHPEVVARSEALLLIRSQIGRGPLSPP
ncbi:MAG: hypothetical protein AAF513_08770 [Pseudomonadota bacterium]